MSEITKDIKRELSKYAPSPKAPITLMQKIIDKIYVSKVGFNFNRVYGYTQNQDKEISVDLSQAATVKLIFDEFQNGRSCRRLQRN